MTRLFDRVPDTIFRLFSIVVIGVLLTMIVFPLYFMATTAFKFEGEIYSELTWIPREPTLQNFRDVVTQFQIPIYLRNTLIVALSTTIVMLGSTIAVLSTAIAVLNATMAALRTASAVLRTECVSTRW